MSRNKSLILPPLSMRVRNGRPVMNREQLLNLGQRILRLSTVDIINVTITHTAQSVTRLANDRVLSGDDGERVWVQIQTMAGGPPAFYIFTNQIDDSVLQAGIQRCEALIRAGAVYQPDSGMKHESLHQDVPISTNLWYDSTVKAMAAAEHSTTISKILDAVRSEQLQAAGFLGIMARAEGVVRKDGNIVFFHDETDSEINVIARSRDGKSTGWAGRAARDWSKLNYAEATQHAIEMARRGTNPVAFEPGRHTAILTPTAVAQLLRYFAQQWDAFNTDGGLTALSKSPRGGNKLRQRIFDSRLTMISDPADSEGGYRPYIAQDGVATPPMTWVDHGILTNMAYSMYYAMDRGKRYSQHPHSLRLTGGTTSIEQMISGCTKGIFVNRFSGVEQIDEGTGLLTGVTQGGCFLVKDGKIDKPLKNFRFLDSPFFFLNNIEALGVPERAAFGYTPRGEREMGWGIHGTGEWPRQPMIVPPIMVRDFNFNALAEVI